jgi:prolyl oligopeptidase
MSYRSIAYLMLVSVLIAGCGRKDLHYPATAKRPVSDQYHGVTVVDDYRWLAEQNSPEVRAWVDAQNAVTRSYLDGMRLRNAVEKRVQELLEIQAVSYSSLIRRGPAIFALKFQPPANQPLLVRLASPLSSEGENVVLDLNALDSTGATAIDWYVPSAEGKLVAVCLSKGGSEDGSAHVFNAVTGEKLADVVPRVQYPTGGGDLAWNKEGTGFFYTRYPHEGERPAEDRNFYQQVYFHLLGTPASQDVYAIGKEFPRIAETRLEVSKDGGFLLATVANGDGGEFSHYLRWPDGKWKQVTKNEDRVKSISFGPGKTLLALSRAGAPRGKILSLPVSRPQQVRVVIPEAAYTIESFLVTDTKLVVARNTGGPSSLTIYSTGGEDPKEVALPPVSTVADLVDIGGNAFLMGVQSYLEPFAWRRCDAATGTLVPTSLGTPVDISFDDATVVREKATSKDGTKIPLNLIMKKGTARDGRNPVLLRGYGGFGSIESPSFSRIRRFWLDCGGIVAETNLRGGGEFGDPWHEQGMLTRKQNVFDDFIACSRYLIDSGYTSREHLAIEGGSNGGLLMGAVLTQVPSLYRAVVSHVGIYDMLRMELFPNGAFNITEYGTVKNPEQFAAMYAYSPYHHVVRGTAYPAVFLLSGENDGRVDPANSRKMAAILQDATSSGLPILLLQSSGSGHGIGTGLNARIRQTADVYAFLCNQLGIDVP